MHLDDASAIWEYVLERQPGCPDEFRFPTAGEDWQRALAQQLAMDGSLKNQVILVCEKIADYIQHASPNDQKVALNLKRHVYNGRFSKVNELIGNSSLKIDPRFPIQATRDLLALKSSLNATSIELAEAGDRELSRFSYEMAEFARSDYFQRTLILTTDGSSVKRLTATVESEGWTKITSTIFKFWLRCCFKVSPFSNFGTIYWKRRDPASVANSHPESNKVLCTPNTYILYHLRGALLRGDSEIRGRIRIHRNPTLHYENGGFEWFVQGPPTDQFKRVKQTAMVECILDIFRSCDEILLKDLIEFFRARLQTSFDTAQRISLHCITEGMLQAAWPFSAVDPEWPFQVHEFLEKSLETPLPNYAVQNWQRFLARISEFGRASATERWEILTDIENGLYNFFRALDKDFQSENAIPRRKLVLEDVYVKSDASPPSHEVACSLKTLNFLSQFGTVLTREHTRKLSLAGFFFKSYGADAEVPLLRFYRSAIESGAFQDEIPSARDSDDPSLRNSYSGLESFISARGLEAAKTGNCLRLYSAELTRLFPDRLSAVSSETHFYSAIIQKSCLSTGGILLNALTPGLGRSISRFLSGDHLPSRSWKSWIGPHGANLHEFSDNTFFNGNLHPPIYPNQITCPGGEAYSRETTTSIGIRDLVVRLGNGKLHLSVRGSQAPVYVADLSFLAPQMRSKLYRFVMGFSRTPIPAASYISGMAYSSADKLSSTNSNISWYPRIVVDDSVIIARKCCIVSVKELGIEIAHLNSEGEKFWRIFQWASALDIPRHTYVRCVDRLESGGKGDTSKPQFIDFESIACVKYLQQLISRPKTSLLFAEADPDPVGRSSDLREYVYHWRVDSI